MNNEIIQTVKSALRIETVIQDDLGTLKQSGANLKACCPFHTEKTASFTVFPATQKAKCFGCGFHGDAVDYISARKGIGYGQAARLLAEQYEVTLPVEAADNPDGALYAANKIAAKYFQETLLNGPRHHKEYLVQRGIDNKDILLKWGIGFAGIGYKLPCDPASSQGAGLLNSTGQNFFNNRFMFPICNAVGSVIGFSGRAIGDEKPKYINISDTNIYHKSDVLYGINHALPYMRKHQTAIVVEGFFGCIWMHKMGYCQTVATCGTSLTASHAKMLSKHVTDVALLYDGDMWTDEKKLRRLGDTIYRLWAAGLNATLYRLPGTLDPADYLQMNRQLADLPEVGAIEFCKLQNISLQELAEKIALCHNGIVRDNLINDTALWYGANKATMASLVSDYTMEKFKKDF